MGKKILLADDSITIQKVIELTFSDEDFDVVTVGNGRLALERLPEVRPDIVLCDIIMPEKDGYEVCEQIKSNPSWSQIPVLLLTGAFEPFDQERASKAGYDGSLAKPFEPETLIAKVKELLARAPRPATVSASVAPPAPAASHPSAPPPAHAGVPARVPAGTTPVAFIPEEPFSGLDARAFVSGSPVPATPPLVEISAEEAATLNPESAVTDDTNATVVFRSGERGWPAAAPAVEPPSPAEPEPERLEEEPPAFEAVLEEDLDFGPGDFVPPQREAQPERLVRPEFGTLPPVRSPEASSGPFAALVRDAPVPAGDPLADTSAFQSSSAFSDEVLLEPEGVVAPDAEPSILATAPEGLPRTLLESATSESARLPLPPPPPRAPEAPEVIRPSEARARLDATPKQPPVSRPAEPAASAPLKPPVRPEYPMERPRTLLDAIPAPRPEPPKPTPAVAPPPPPPRPHLVPPVPAVVESARVARDEGSFAEVETAVPEPLAPPRPSEAGEVSVPVEMVEKIAHRVIGQISEKIVREIAWEVIPDLAETLIKREIDRLKAELSKM